MTYYIIDDNSDVGCTLKVPPIADDICEMSYDSFDHAINALKSLAMIHHQMGRTAEVDLDQGAMVVTDGIGNNWYWSIGGC